jgi:prepilin-type N-terminal cleavage/methylation domain-containing protein
MKTTGHNHPPRPTHGFTLLEVMLALAILGMVMSVVYSTWTAVLRARQAAHKAAMHAQRSRVAIRAIESALNGVQFFQQNQPYYSFIADTSGTYAFLSVASRLPDSFPGSGLFGEQSLRRVTFSVEQGTNNAPQLVMRQYPLLMATNNVHQDYPIVLAPELTDFLLEFWDNRRGEWIGEWLYTNQLPTVVRFMLGVGKRSDDPSKPQAVQVQTVAISAFPVPADLQGRGARPPIRPGGTNAPGPGPNPPNNPGNGGGGNVLPINPGRGI